MLSIKTHNILDYVIGAALVLAPYVFNFFGIDAARNVFLVLGLGLIGYSLFTNYRYSIAKIIPLGVHMTMDVLAGAILMISPWFFGYRGLLSSGQLGLHFVMGLGAWALVAFTNRRTETAVVSEFRRDRIDRAA